MNDEFCYSWNQDWDKVIMGDDYQKPLKAKRHHCPVCFRDYVLVDCELIQTCSCPQNSNICGRHGLNNHNCGS